VYAVTQPKETAARLAVLCGHLSNGLEHIADRYTAEQLCEAAGHVLGHGIVFTAVPGALAGAGVGGRVVLDAVAGAKVGLTAASDMVKSAAAAKLVSQYGGEVVTAAVGAVKNSTGRVAREGGVVCAVEKSVEGIIKRGVNETCKAILKDGYYEVNGFKFSEYYYNKLWSTGRGAPSLVAKEVLEHGVSTAVSDAIKQGFYKYTYGDWEMVYNPVTKEVWHLQPVR